jgi:hypothetical protein
MSTDQSPLAVPAPFGAPDLRSPRPGVVPGPDAPAPRDEEPAVVRERATVGLDETAWCRWWRDLIVERYRVDRFEAFVPLPADACPWAMRVALGRLVEQSMVDIAGPSMATQLVVEAIEFAGFGRVRDLAPDARRVALVRAGWWSDPWAGDDDLRLAVLGTVADALLREVPPTDLAVDLRAEPPGPDAASLVASTVRAAARRAVFAYAGHVEGLASRSRDTARSYQF